MSETTIDTLVLDIETNAPGASLEIDKLAASLENLKSKGKLTTVTNNLKKLSEGINSIKSSSSANQKLSELATALTQLRDSTKGNKLKSVLDNLQRIPEITKQMKPEVIKQFASYMNQLATALAPLSTQINNISSGFGKLPARLTSCVSAMSKMEKSSKSLRSRLGGLGNVLQGFLGITLSGFAAGSYFSSSINEINSFVENLNYSNQVMRDYAEEAQNYAYRVQDVFGIDAGAFIEAQSTFMSLAQGFGLAGDKAYALSKGMTELAYDISSFKDEHPEEVFIKLQSAIAGEIEPVRRWGVALDQASMKQWMLKNGIDANINSLTQADKALIRYNMTVETMAKNGAIYDLARTLNSPANALRILQQQFTQLSRAVGSVFIPILIAVIPYVQAFVKVLTGLITTLATLLGFEMPVWTSKDWAGLDGLSSSVDDTNSGLDDAKEKAKEFKKQLMGFDELNIISKPSSGSSGNSNSGNDGGVSAGVDPLKVWDNGVLGEFEKKVDDIVPKVETMLTIVGGIGAAILLWKVKDSFITAIGGVRDVIGVISGKATMPIKSPFFDKLATSAGTALTKITNLATGLGLTPAKFGIAVGAAALLVGAFIDLYNNSETFRTAVQTALTNIGTAFQNAWNTIWTYGISPLLNAFGITATSISDLYTTHIRPKVEAIGTLCVNIFGTTIVTALNLFSGTFQTVTGVIKGLLTGDWTQALNGVKTIFDALPGNIGTAFANMATKAKEKLTTAKTTLATAAGTVKTAVQSKFNEMKTNALAKFDDIRTKGKNKLEFMKAILGTAAITAKAGVQEKFNTMKSKVLEKFDNIKTSGKSKLENMKSTLKTAAGTAKSGVQSKFSEMKNNVVSYFGSIKTKGKEALDSLKTVIKSPINGIIGGVESMVNGIITAINGMVGAFNKLSWKIPDWVPGALAGKTFGFNLATVTPISIPRFEKGGFLEDGLFTMNRGEIAGKFNNGQSVVANNMQIIKGIREGVMEGIRTAISGDLHTIAKTLSEANRINYRVVGANTVAQTSSDSSQLTEAVYNAISENNGRGGTFTVIVDMDGDVVAKKVFKVHNDKVIQTGKSPLLGY